jgi:hypothetical protein
MKTVYPTTPRPPRPRASNATRAQAGDPWLGSCPYHLPPVPPTLSVADGGSTFTCSACAASGTVARIRLNGPLRARIWLHRSAP